MVACFERFIEGMINFCRVWQNSDRQDRMFKAHGNIVCFPDPVKSTDSTVRHQLQSLALFRGRHTNRTVKPNCLCWNAAQLHVFCETRQPVDGGINPRRNKRPGAMSLHENALHNKRAHGIAHGCARNTQGAGKFPFGRQRIIHIHHAGLDRLFDTFLHAQI